MAAENILDFLPAWYITEKQALKTIWKLTSPEELAFYLKNPDPYTRRLAILRIGQLKNKDSLTMLDSILYDELETDQNRKLAATLIRSLNNELNPGFYSNTFAAVDYDNTDDVYSMLNIPVIDSSPNLSLDFRNHLLESQLNFDNVYLKCNLDEKENIPPFSLKDWFLGYVPVLFSNLKKMLKRALLIFLKYLFIKLPKKVLYLLCWPFRKKSKDSDIKADQTNSYPGLNKRWVRPVKSRTYRPSILALIKKFIKTILAILFAPFRLVYHYKWAILITLISLYCLFSFTTSGKSFLFRINPEAYYMNSRFLSKTKVQVIELINENQTLAVLLGTKNITVKSQEPKPNINNEIMIVTAPKGLYLRDQPKPNALKIALMKKDTVVEFLNEQVQGDNGIVYYKIKLDEATWGWANAGYLRRFEYERPED